jgi:hypothetical protein
MRACPPFNPHRKPVPSAHHGKQPFAMGGRLRKALRVAIRQEKDGTDTDSIRVFDALWIPERLLIR